MASSEVISVLFSGGIAAAITVLVNAYRFWKEAKQKQEETILGRWKDELRRSSERLAEEEQESEYQEQCAIYWRSRTADVEFLLRQSGIQVPNAAPMPVRARHHGVPSTHGEQTPEGTSRDREG